MQEAGQEGGGVAGAAVELVGEDVLRRLRVVEPLRDLGLLGVRRDDPVLALDAVAVLVLVLALYLKL